MGRKCLVVGLAALVLVAGQVSGSADWKSKAAKKAVGKAAQNGMENAVEDAVKDAAFGAAMDAATPDLPDLEFKRDDESGERPGDVPDMAEKSGGRGDRSDAVAVGSSAARGIETAMDVADFAQDIDTAIDVADKAKKANKVRKIIK